MITKNFKDVGLIVDTDTMILEASPHKITRKALTEHQEARQKLTNFKQLEIGIKSGFTGSSIGELLRHPACTEEGMMLALTNPSSVQYMNDSGDNHHYANIIDHRNITKKVLRFIVDNSKNEPVVAYAKDKLSGFVVRKARRMKRLQELKIKTIRRGKAKIRVAASEK
jgi:hypothetical protein